MAPLQIPMLLDADSVRMCTKTDAGNYELVVQGADELGDATDTRIIITHDVIRLIAAAALVANDRTRRIGR